MQVQTLKPEQAVRETPLLVDVREPDEYNAERVPGSVNVPLSTFASAAPDLLAQFPDRRIVFMCRSGNRARMAVEQAKGLGLHDPARHEVHDGGILRWKREGGPVVSAGKAPLSLMRQVQLTAGGLAAAFAGLGFLVHPAFSLGAVGVGLGLFFAGATGTCALANVLAKAPWNRADASGSCATA